MVLQRGAERGGSLEQGGLGEGIQRERVAAAVGQADAAGGNIDVQIEAGMRNQLVDDGLVEHERQQAVPERVAAEDVRDLAADDGTQAVTAQRTGRVLWRPAAPEVVAGEQERGTAVFGPGIARAEGREREGTSV